jgi:hypothetical protein
MRLGRENHAHLAVAADAVMAAVAAATEAAAVMVVADATVVSAEDIRAFNERAGSRALVDHIFVAEFNSARLWQPCPSNYFCSLSPTFKEFTIYG